MARKYKRLNYGDRQLIEKMCRQGYRVEDIAAKINVHRGTLYRELQRGGAGNGQRDLYSADKAQKYYAH